MDERIRSKLIQEIDAYDGRIPTLGRLIAHLDAIWSVEEGWEEEARKQFRRQWGVLEQIYALALDGAATDLPTSDQKDIREALGPLREIVQTVR